MDRFILSHGHRDHWSGLQVLTERFPAAEVYAIAGVAELIRLRGSATLERAKRLYGARWRRFFDHWIGKQLDTLPRVTTETGAPIAGPVTEELQALNLMNIYLAQLKPGYSYTSVYLLRDRTDEGGNQSFGFYRADYTPRKAALYLHNLTTILTDKGRLAEMGQLDFAIQNQPETVHDLLLQRSDGTFQLIVWGERLTGEDHLTLQFGGRHSSVEIYDPTLGAISVEKLADVSSINLTVSNHPLIIAIPPIR